MNKLLKILASVMLACALTTSATAGMVIGGTLATAGYGAEGTETNGQDNKKTSSNGLFAGDHVEIFAEYDTGANVALGISYTPMEIDTPSNSNKQTARTNTVHVSFKDKTTLYLLFRHDTGLYAKIGATYVDVLTNESTSSSYPDTDTYGATLGLGWQINGASDSFWRVELQGTAYEDVDVNNGTAAGAAGSNKVEIFEMYGAQATLSFGKSF